MCVILLGLIIDQLVPGGLDSSPIFKVVHTLMDFVFLAQYKSHTSNTLSLMQESLSQFYDNKTIFLNLGVQNQFNLSKLHSLSHSASSIQLFRTMDNYNTEQSKHLYIDLAKDAYHATNHKEKYSQMTKWLEHHEKVQYYSAFID